MQKKELFKVVLNWFEGEMPSVAPELQYKTPYQLLVAVILSAQCTDKRVNMVTPPLFERFPTPSDLGNASIDEVYSYIRSVSYPNNKAKHLVGMGAMLSEKFNSQVPSEVKLLEELPGVGRKTAHVIASVIFQKPTLAVDTHVFRVSARLGLTTNAKTPLETEKQLMKYIPNDKVFMAHHWLIMHGRYVCTARSPKCNACGLQTYCKSAKEFLNKKK